MKYIIIFAISLSTITLQAQRHTLLKYDEELLFEDSISADEYQKYFKRCCAFTYKIKDEKTLLENDIYHLSYKDSLAEILNFYYHENSQKFDTSYSATNSFYFFMKNDKIFVRYLKNDETKYHMQYHLVKPTIALQTPNSSYYNKTRFYFEDYVNISNVKYDCYVFEEINDNYRKLVYLSKDNAYPLKIMTFYSNYISIEKVYEIEKSNH